MSYRFRSAGAIALLLTTLSLAVAAPATAEPADRFMDERVQFQVEDVTTEHGTLFLSLNLNADDPGAGFLFTPTSGEYQLIPAETPLTGYDVNGMHVTATIPILRLDLESGETTPVGDARVVATLVRTADPTRIDQDDRFGNRWERYHGTVGPIAAAGTVTLPDGLVLPFSDAPGTLALIDVFRTNPHARITAEQFSGTFAIVETEDGFAIVLVELHAEGGDFSFVEALFVPSDPEQAPLYGREFIPATGMFAVETAIPVTFPDETPAGDARLSLSLRRTTQRGHYLSLAADWNRRVTEEVLIPTGSIAFPGAPRFDLAKAEATLLTLRTTMTDSNSDGPQGRPVVNDTTRGALPVAVGSTVRNVWTGGTAVEPEYRTPPFEVGIGHTVWYRLTGTGAPITIDTAGSDFDTVLAVYTLQDGEMTLLTFGTDTIVGRTAAALKLQAQQTFDTVAGETYYVQFGGYEDVHDTGDVPEVGRLQFTVR